MKENKPEIFYFRILRDKCIVNKKRSQNIYVAVFRMSSNYFFEYIGEAWANSASYKGEKAMAADILAENLNYKLEPGGYYIAEPDIELRELP